MAQPPPRCSSRMNRLDRADPQNANNFDVCQASLITLHDLYGNPYNQNDDSYPRSPFVTDLPHHVERAATTGGLPVSPSMGPALEQAGMPADRLLVDRRVILVSLLSIVLALAAAVIAQVLLW